MRSSNVWTSQNLYHGPCDLWTLTVYFKNSTFAGILDENNKRTDVDKDFILMFTVTDENLSYYLEENIQRFTTSSSLDPGTD